MKPPKKPHWRWVIYKTLVGEEHDDAGDDTWRFIRHLEETYDAREARLDAINALDIYEAHRNNDGDLRRAFSLRHEHPIRQQLERMMIEGLDMTLIQEAVYDRFKESISLDAIRYYRDLFWDTERFNLYDFGDFYIEDDERRRPHPPSVKGPFREEYLAFQNGASLDDFDMDDAMERMFQRAFFRSEVLAEMKADEKAQGWVRNATDIFRVLQKKRANEMNREIDELPEEFDYDIEYPDETAADAEELTHYEPAEDIHGESD